MNSQNLSIGRPYGYPVAMSASASAITLQQLRVLLAVADCAGFSKAGDAIGLSQPAVSQSVRALEAALGLKLLDRSSREVLLTPVGQGLAGPLRRVLDELDEVLGQAQALGASARGVVRVASAPTISAGLMPQCLALARQRLPALSVKLIDQAQQLAVDSLRQGAVDFAVVVGTPGLDDLHRQTLCTERFVLVCPAAHPWASRVEIALAELAGQPLILLDQTSGSRPLIDAALHSAGVAATVAFDAGHASTAFRMVAAGLGLSVLPALSLPLPDQAGLRAVPMAPALQRQLLLLRRRNRSLAPPAQALWQLVAEVASR